ncbi:hypothetical protein RU07_20815 [Agrobacterium tumefaciens]|uniref:Uncharacterized protein n=1 Tax=Agrobacterium tumefaciens TaxID=358 RepID=A0A0D0KQB7_AGRTU|nr:hypothetical protein RU07_20815 [Agrobacterium tumefaciens]
MTNPGLNYRFTERRSAYANFVAYLEYLNAEQAENRATRRCIVRIVKVRGCDGEISAKEGWRMYCQCKPHMIGREGKGGL